MRKSLDNFGVWVQVSAKDPEGNDTGEVFNNRLSKMSTLVKSQDV